MPHKPQHTIDGLPVRNLTKKIKLVITKEDCSGGHKRAPGSCAAALAAKRDVPNCIEARIHIGRVFLKVRDGKREYWLRGKTPNSLRTEIATFDRGGTFEPGTYAINPLSFSETPRGLRKSKNAPKHGRPGVHRAKPKILYGVRGSGRDEYRVK